MRKGREEGLRFTQSSCSVQFSHSAVSNSLRPHESQHARPPCPSPTPRVYSNSCPHVRLGNWPHKAAVQEEALGWRFKCEIYQHTLISLLWDKCNHHANLGIAFLMFLDMRKRKLNERAGVLRINLRKSGILEGKWRKSFKKEAIINCVLKSNQRHDFGTVEIVFDLDKSGFSRREGWELGWSGLRKRMGGWRLEPALWTTFKFCFRRKVRNRVVSIGASPEKAVLFFWWES